MQTFQIQLYHLEQFANSLVAHQLTHLTPLSIGVVFAAGLLTSMTPCMLSMLPITIGYIGGYEAKNRWQAAIQSTWFVLGLATTLAVLGVVATEIGRIYGQVGLGLPIAVSLVAIVMGLNLLEALPLRFPAFGEFDFIAEIPEGFRAYFVGLTFGLVASPCSTPVLATLLAWVASTGDPLVGGGLLLTYTVGYAAPLVLAGTFTAAIKQFLELRRWSSWITPASGALLVGFGVFSLLFRLFPAVS
ncbi:Cytochrome c-type biogenesis protein CcdA (DsbD analog) [uncultured Leptolyngbya sp.]|uniref:Cytochrome c-type biogenesis protein CcdA (DsbD analog) n=1 Tax=uncultured Leptolyngbya sp. TaxID=332963 RepID=A0A6J4PD84_9CYAN|nr:Cytochrome c-type biogenesis protein CcdA (DsbD analog) [uncultured Leptolyngbya sp.]